jgi:uncharacterized membrane protein YphA (DoxX/SURF4 family)
MPFVGTAIRIAAGAVWIVAGAAKVGELRTFETQVAQYRLLPHVLTAAFAYALPFVELLVGLYLLVGLLTRAAAIVACVLLALFLIALAQAWARGLNLDCGCFGSLTHSRVGAWSIVRDLAIGLPAVVMAIWPARRLSLDRRLFGTPE